MDRANWLWKCGNWIMETPLKVEKKYGKQAWDLVWVTMRFVDECIYKTETKGVIFIILTFSYINFLGYWSNGLLYSIFIHVSMCFVLVYFPPHITPSPFSWFTLSSVSPNSCFPPVCGFCHLTVPTSSKTPSSHHMVSSLVLWPTNISHTCTHTWAGDMTQWM